MPDRMSEYISDRMSEYIPDRMPDRLTTASVLEYMSERVPEAVVETDCQGIAWSKVMPLK